MRREPQESSRNNGAGAKPGREVLEPGKATRDASFTDSHTFSQSAALLKLPLPYAACRILTLMLKLRQRGV